MRKQKSVTVWFGKEIDIEDVRRDVRRLNLLGYKVRAPFYIGYSINDEIVYHYLQNSLDTSDFLYVLGEEGSMLEKIMAYAQETGKPIVGDDFKVKCLVK